MPIIPDERSIQRRGISGGLPGVSPPQWVDPVPGAEEALNAQAERMLIKQQADAETAFYLRKTEIDGAFDEDTDWQTMPDRYEQAISTALEESSAGISNARFRDEFLNRAMLDAAAGRERVQNLAFAREGEQVRGEHIEQQGEIVNAAMRSGDLGYAVDWNKRRTDEMVNSGYLSADKASATHEKFKTDLAVGWIETMPPGQQIAQLRTPEAIKYIPENTRKIMLRRAQEQHRIDSERYEGKNRLRNAIGYARTTLVGANYSLPEALSVARADTQLMRDPLLYDEVQRQIESEWNRQNKVRDYERDNILKEVYPKIYDNDNDFTVDDLTPEQERILTYSDIEALRAAQYTPSTKIGYNRPAEDRMRQLEREGRWQDLRDYFVSVHDVISEEQHKRWSELSLTVVKPAEGVLTPSQRVGYALDAAGIKGEALRGEAYRVFDNWYRGFQDRNRREPTDNEREDFIKAMMEDVVTDKGTVYDSTRTAYQIKDAGEIAGAASNFYDEDPWKFDAMVKAGVDISSAPQMQYYWNRHPPSDHSRIQVFSKNHNKEYSEVMQAIEDRNIIGASPRTIIEAAKALGYGHLL